MVKLSAPVMLAAGLVGAVVLFVASKGARETGLAIGGAAVDLADGVLSGGVMAVGDLVGVPRTEPTACEAAKASGSLWDVSFACPAADYFRQIPKSFGLFN